MKKSNPKALMPIGVFLVLYLGLGIVFEYVMKIPMGFYNIPIVLAFMVAILVACFQNREVSFDDKLSIMAQGLADKKEIDQAITDILTTTDEEERQELYRFVLTRLHEDAVYIPLTFECNKALYTKNLQGVHFGTDQYDVPFADMYFE